MNILHNLKGFLLIIAVCFIIFLFFSGITIKPEIMSILFFVLACYCLFDAIKTFKSKKYKTAILLLITDIINTLIIAFTAYLMFINQTEHSSHTLRTVSLVFVISTILSGVLKVEHFKV